MRIIKKFRKSANLPTDRTPRLSTYGMDIVKVALAKAERLDRKRRFAWARYYALQDENKRLRAQVACLNGNRWAFYRLFQLVRRSEALRGTEMAVLARYLREALAEAEVLGVVSCEPQHLR